MAFCTNCGQSLQEGARFCTNCGNAVQQTVAPKSAVVVVPAAARAASPAAPQAATAATAETVPDPDRVSSPNYPPGAPEQSTSRSFMLLCAALLILIGAGIISILHLRNQGKANSETRQIGPSQQQSTAAASAPVAAPAVPESVRIMNLGNYPGATPVAIATLSGETVAAGFLTHDTPQQVIEFYKIRFPVSSATEDDAKAELAATLPDGNRIRIQAQPQGGITQVMVLLEP